MRIKGDERGYTMWLAASDTYHWARKPGASWPCSTLSGWRVRVEVDSNGLVGLTVNGTEASEGLDGHELAACVADHLPEKYRHLWPTWALLP